MRCIPYIENCIFRPSHARKSLTRNIYTLTREKTGLTLRVYCIFCRNLHIYNIKGGRPTHTRAVRTFRRKYSICRVRRPCTLYICVSVKCVVPLTSKIVYFFRPTPGKASREIYTCWRVKKTGLALRVYCIFCMMSARVGLTFCVRSSPPLEWVRAYPQTSVYIYIYI